MAPYEIKKGHRRYIMEEDDIGFVFAYRYISGEGRHLLEKRISIVQTEPSQMDTGQIREYFRADQFHVDYEGVTSLEYATGEGPVLIVHVLLLEGVDARRSPRSVLSQATLSRYSKSWPGLACRTPRMDLQSLL